MIIWKEKEYFIGMMVNRYEGDFKNDKSEGKGIIYYNSGNRYEGDFKNDNIEGKGIFYWNDGS